MSTLPWAAAAGHHELLSSYGYSTFALKNKLPPSPHLHFSLRHPTTSPTARQTIPLTMSYPPSIDRYLKSPIITLQIGSPPHETTLSAHLALLQSSPWFNDQCADYTTETPTYLRTVHLPDDDIDAVGAFLEYLYTKEYSPRLVAGPSGKPEDMVLEDAGDADVDEGGDRLLKHAKVYTLAEKLRIPELKHLAHSKIHRINSTAKGELKYAKFVYENTTRDDDTIRKPIASFWAHRSRSPPTHPRCVSERC